MPPTEEPYRAPPHLTGRKLAAVVVVAIFAFAGNSLLARAALGGRLIGAGAFSAIRLAAGAAVLAPFLRARPSLRDAPGAAFLALYVAFFAFAYLKLPTATGALILFSAVQLTILLVGLARGAGLSSMEGGGLALALGGLAWLLAPSAGAVALRPAALMAAAGVAWGAYTLVGRRVTAPARQTAVNFLLAALAALPLVLLDPPGTTTPAGVGLAVVAGALTSGGGYVLWYAVTPRITLATTAAVQLATPLAAALGAALFLAEPLTWRLAGAAVLILTGVALTLRPR